MTGEYDIDYEKLADSMVKEMLTSMVKVKPETKAKLLTMSNGMRVGMPELIEYLIWWYETEHLRTCDCDSINHTCLSRPQDGLC